MRQVGVSCPGARMRGKLTSFILMLAAAFMAAVSVAPAARADTTLTGVRIGQHADRTRVVLEVTEQAPYRAFLLDNPARIVVDMDGARWNLDPAGAERNALFSAVRHGRLDSGATRVVFDLTQPVEILDAFALPAAPSAGKPERLVLDVRPVSHAVFAGQLSKVHGQSSGAFGGGAVSATGDAPGHRIAGAWAGPKIDRIEAFQTHIKTPAAQMRLAGAYIDQPLPRRKPNLARPLVVIDPGHGGGDPGAVGVGRVYEKHVTLSVAKELKKQLENSGRYKVMLTRDTDTYVKLRERFAIAREAGAALFISLHADKINRQNVRGASIYTLSEDASDAETAALAERENHAGIVAGVDLAVENDDVAGILLDLAMRETMNESKFFANILVDSLKSDRITMLQNPHRSAGFAVLKAPDIPSVLVELGFMSSPREARQLQDHAYQSKLARALLRGIDRYFTRLHALHKS